MGGTIVAAALAAGLASAPAAAAVQANARAHAVVLRPLTLVKNADLDFGWLAPLGGAGTAVITPAGVFATTGGVVGVGGAPRPAQFTGASGSPGAVKVTIPSAPITIRRIGGTETMQVDSWTVTGAPPGQLGRREAFTFFVGATLRVNADQLPGDYVGTFNVTVDYR